MIEVGSRPESIAGERAVACSVCIANFNGAAFIGECLSSVLGQKTDFGVEVIVHDDCSSDDSVSVVCRSYPDVVLLESRSNVGFSASNNRMVDLARGEHVLLLNNDASLRPGALQALFDASDFDTLQILTLPQFDASTGQLVDRGLRLDPFLNAVANRDEGRALVAAVHGACFWIRRDLWHSLGGFPPVFESMAEDLFLCCVLRLRGGIVRVLSSPGFDHQVGRSFGGGKVVDGRLQTTRRRRGLSERNRMFVMFACYPSPWLQLLLPMHILLLMLEGAILSIVFWDSRLWREIYWKALRDLWSTRARLVTMRRAVQMRRQISSREFFSVFWMFHRKVAALFRHGLPSVTR